MINNEEKIEACFHIKEKRRVSEMEKNFFVFLKKESKFRGYSGKTTKKAAAAAAASRMTWLCLPGRWGEEEEEARWGGGGKKNKEAKGGWMKNRSGERGLTIKLGSTDKDGGQMLSPVFSGWTARVSTPNIGK